MRMIKDLVKFGSKKPLISY